MKRHGAELGGPDVVGLRGDRVARRWGERGGVEGYDGDDGNGEGEHLRGSERGRWSGKVVHKGD